MNNYARPTIEIAQQLSEGVYLSLSGNPQVDLQEAFDAANGNAEDLEVNAADITGAETQDASDSVGEAPDTGNESADTPDNGQMGAETSDTDQTGTEGTDADGQTEADEDGEQDDLQGIDAQSDDDVVDEDSIGMAGSGLVTCDSDYMNGVWQGRKEGSWGGVQMGCKEVWGCKGCPADKGNGCGLQDTNAVSQYFRYVGLLKPEWEASGKLPTSNPYGI